jgi:molybdopterin/thiamine biosynthesis adenylyltransferase
MKALANEIAKNLVLAGIGSLTIQDEQAVVDDDLGAQFFISEQSIGLNVRFAGFVESQVLIRAPACRSFSNSNQEA